MTRRLVMIHGRAQEHKDSIALKSEWLAALREGLAKSGVDLPIPESEARFPFYGDTLYDLVGGKAREDAAAVIVRGRGDNEEQRFRTAIIREIGLRTGVTEEQLAQVAGPDVVERGVLNWEWVQGILRVVDRNVPGSSVTLALFTNDVYQYLKNPAIREDIEKGIIAAMTPGVETVVVAHSLGTVVAYNLLRLEGRKRGWKVPRFVTVGAPLGLAEISRTLKSLAPLRCPECVADWFNAMDERDVVALYPLTPECFPLNPATPAILNRTGVNNKTPNRHGIAGYLDDQETAKRIYDALVA